MKKTRNIVIDCGNTRIKTGLFENGIIQQTRTWKPDQLPELKVYCGEYQPDKIGLITVGLSSEKILNALNPLPVKVININSPLPVEVNYGTPETLGIDRLVACVGAWESFPNRNALVIDLGSCITYDLIDKNAVYQGGIISPGLRMRMVSMSQNTSNLPDISHVWTQNHENFPGKSTIECMSIGVFGGVIHELNCIIERFSQEYSDLVVILTGGDTPHFESKLKEPIFADQNLVLKGLNRIIDTNEER